MNDGEKVEWNDEHSHQQQQQQHQQQLFLNFEKQNSIAKFRLKNAIAIIYTNGQNLDAWLHIQYFQLQHQ